MGKGIAIEISIKIIEYGFEKLGIDKIIRIADPSNIGSYKVLEKIGMQFYKLDIYDANSDQKYNWYEIEKQTIIQ